MRVVLDFINTTTPERVDEILKATGSTIVKTLDVKGLIYLVDAPRLSVFKPYRDEVLYRDDAKTNIQPMAFDPRDVSPGDARDWWIGAITPYAPKTAWTLKRPVDRATVYLVDSGVNLVSELTDRVEHAYSFNGDHVDRRGHGTALASLICGKNLGLTGVGVKSVKLFDEGVPTLLSDILTAIQWMVNDHAAVLETDPSHVGIVNCSWIVDKDATIENALAQALERRLIVVAAAGNGGNDVAAYTPGSMEGVITVGACTEAMVPANFSNIGEAIDFWMPGTALLAQKADGQYATIDGTSPATAIATAAVANFISYAVAEYAAELTAPDLVEVLLAQSTGVKTFPNCINAQPRLLVAGPAVLGVFEPGETVSLRLYHPEDMDAIDVAGLPVGFRVEAGVLSGVAPDVAGPTISSFTVKLTKAAMSSTFVLEFVTVPAGHAKDGATLSQQTGEEVVVAPVKDRIIAYQLASSGSPGKV